MDSDEIQVASSPATTPNRRDSVQHNQNQNENPKPAAALANTKKKLFKLPKGQKFSTPASFDNDSDLNDDLKDLGFPAKRVKELLAKEEPVVDGHGQIPQHSHVKKSSSDDEKEAAGNGGRGERLQRNAAAGAAGGGKGKGKGKGKGRYEHLYFDEDSNWVLFDPLAGYPKQAGEPPKIFSKYETFRPGNTKILEYNVESQSMRIKSTPKVLLGEGRDVQYLPTGPRIVEVKSAGGGGGDGGDGGGGKRRKRRGRVEVVASSSDLEDEGGGEGEEREIWDSQSVEE